MHSAPISELIGVVEGAILKDERNFKLARRQPQRALLVILDDDAARESVIDLRRRRLMRMRMDYVLILVVAALLILGLMMVYSSTFDMAYVEYGNPNRFFIRQLLWVILGVGALVAFARIDYHLWRRWAVLLMAGTLPFFLKRTCSRLTFTWQMLKQEGS